jgi:hypothetical protein
LSSFLPWPLAPPVAMAQCTTDSDGSELRNVLAWPG